MDKQQERKYPFNGCKINDPSFLDEHSGRLNCPNCKKSRKYFCYACNVPLDELKDRIPQVKVTEIVFTTIFLHFKNSYLILFLQLPIKIDIIKHKQEGEGKSTSSHAKLLAPDDVEVYLYPNIPEYTLEEGVFLVFPAANSISIQHLVMGIDPKVKENFGLPKGDHMGTLLSKKLSDLIEEETVSEELPVVYNLENLPIKKAVFIDSTWNQSRSIYKDIRVRSLRTVVIQNRISQFWRHQRGSPRWFLATIEAIHQLVTEIHVYAFGLDTNYKGLDNLEAKVDSPRLIEHEDPSQDSQSDLVAPYNGQYDNILFFFQHFYNLIHRFYDENELLAYKRPLL